MTDINSLYFCSWYRK